MLEGKKRVKRVSESGVGTERAVRKKGVKNAKNGRKGYPDCYYQNSIAIRSRSR